MHLLIFGVSMLALGFFSGVIVCRVYYAKVAAKLQAYEQWADEKLKRQVNAVTGAVKKL